MGNGRGRLARRRSLGGLLAEHATRWGADEHFSGPAVSRVASGGKGAGTAGGPGAVRRIRRDLIMLAASLAVFAGCAVIAADGGPTGRAGGVPRRQRAAGWLYRPMVSAQYLGVLAMPLVVAAFALGWRRWRLAAALVLVVPLKLVLEGVASCWCSGSGPGRRCPMRSARGAASRAELHLRARHHHLRDRRAARAGVAPPLGGGRVRCWRHATGWRGCTWARTTRWMWSAGRRSA